MGEPKKPHLFFFFNVRFFGNNIKKPKRKKNRKKTFKYLKFFFQLYKGKFWRILEPFGPENAIIEINGFSKEEARGNEKKKKPNN